MTRSGYRQKVSPVNDLRNMDYFAVVWFGLAAVGFTLLVDYSPLGAKTVTAVMAEHRHR